MRTGTVLIADDEPLLVKALAARCERLDLQVRTAFDGLDALIQARAAPPDVIVINVTMPGADGLSVCDKLRQDPRLRQTPVIVFTGRCDKQVLQACQALHAYHVAKGQEDLDTVEALILRLLPESRARPTPCAARAAAGTEAPAPCLQPRILLVDDDLGLLHALTMRLRRWHVDVSQATGGTEGLRKAFAERPHAIIADFNMDHGNGTTLLRRLKEEEATRDIPVIILTGWTGRGHFQLSEQLRHAGAAAYLRKPLDFARLIAELGRLIGLPADPKAAAS